MTTPEQDTTEGRLGDEEIRFDDTRGEELANALGTAMEVLDIEDDSLPDEVWHYTTTDSASLILRSGTMFATDAEFMNDASELKATEPQFFAAMQRRMSEGDDDKARASAAILQASFSGQSRSTYILSFTELDDDLSQWRNYGAGGGGVALRFDTSKLNEAAQAAHGALSICRYIGSDEVVDQAYRLILAAEEAFDGTDAGRFLHAAVLQLGLEVLAPLHKTAAFAGERELRFWTIQQPRITIADDRAHYPLRRARVRGDYLVPYTPVSIGSSITGVRLGPLHSPDYLRRRYGMRSLLDEIGRNDVDIEASQVPLRD